MPYSTTVSGLDLSSGVPDVRVSAAYTWTEVGGPRGAVELVQDEVMLDLTPIEFLSSTPATFSYAGDLAPPPSPAWFLALYIQEIPRIANRTGWLFRSGLFQTDPPAEPIEVILAPEQLIGAPELAGAIGTLPMTSGSLTITTLTLTLVGVDVAITATGTDTQLPAGVTFVYTATLILIPNGSLKDLDSPFEISLANPSLSFIAGTGTGFVTALLNLFAGVIEGEVAPRLKATVKGLLNAGLLSTVATQLNRGVPASMPPGVVVSIRGVRATTRPLAAGGTEPVIGVRAALGAFGGVVNKFPALSGGSKTCFIATAAFSPDAPEVETLQRWRDLWLRERPGGPRCIALYERLSPPLARFIARSARRRAVARALVVAPAARVAGAILRRASRREPAD